MARVRILVDDDVLDVQLTAWDRIGAEQLMADRGRHLEEATMILYMMATGYCALMREWHGIAKRSEWEPFDEICARADFEMDEGEMGPTVPAPFSDGP